MGDWNRSSREIQPEKMHPEIAAAIQAHVETYELGSILEDVVMCIETRSERKASRLLGIGGEQWMLSTVLVTSAWLIIAGMGEKQGAFANSVQRGKAQVADYAEGYAYRLVPDRGLVVTGAFTGRVGLDGSEHTSIFIPLGEGPLTGRFMALLIQDKQ